MAGFNISDFKSQFSKQGFLRPDIFMVTLSRKQTGVKYKGDSQLKQISFLASAVNIPGLTLDIQEIQRQGFGPIERRVRGAIFPMTAVTFMCDGDGATQQFLHDWLAKCISTDIREGERTQHGLDDDSMGYFGEVGYYDDYVMDMDITIFSEVGGAEDKGTAQQNRAIEMGKEKKKGDITIKPSVFAQEAAKEASAAKASKNEKLKGGVINYHLQDVYPQVMGDLNLGWRQTDEISEIQVQFTYRTYSVETAVNGQAITASEGGRMNLLQFISKMKGAYEIVKSIKKPDNVGDALNVLNNTRTLFSGKKLFGG